MFFRNKRILITGNTGFKGSWISKILLDLGADVYGYALKPNSVESLFELIELEKNMNTFYGDIRDLNSLEKFINKIKPEIVIHMAAQPIVRESYKDPVYTYETNVMGTVNVLEAIRRCDSVRSVVNVTTDKVYKNNEWCWGYRENDPLNGYDPYSNSKSCSELITQTYKQCFLQNKVAVSSVRAGNVIGGGDFAVDRIIPDCVRSALKHEMILVRNPYSIRPYQHVLEPLFAYLHIAKEQYKDINKADTYNIGPNEESCIETGELVKLFCESWGDGLKWQSNIKEDVHEATFLKLDCSKVMSKLGIKPVWNVETAVEKVVEWTKSYQMNIGIKECMEKQIDEYMKEARLLKVYEREV